MESCERFMQRTNEQRVKQGQCTMHLWPREGGKAAGDAAGHYPRGRRLFATPQCFSTTTVIKSVEVLKEASETPTLASFVRTRIPVPSCLTYTSYIQRHPGSAHSRPHTWGTSSQHGRTNFTLQWNILFFSSPHYRNANQMFWSISFSSSPFLPIVLGQR